MEWDQWCPPPHSALGGTIPIITEILVDDLACSVLCWCLMVDHDMTPEPAEIQTDGFK